ncbi:hypothetical protein GCM10010149_67300 [Nonomuraea roseoviolacea subsp. roseoviolacea]|uniref:Ribosomal protein L44E n=1 Tax=Nonomuraea roseoviolacea subsp. carminata TaxID=160689 RepID=A0ABT1JXI1_9ACTN|nr:hypothetical protein [Nonomuraea roseoviolacea]MCP2346451.1 ribosomal protein L44E [Nonomuraea roseoviolacea subsp. carminata]
MSADVENDAVVVQYFARFGRRRHRLARVYGAWVRRMVAEEGPEVLDRIELDIRCECCDEEQARVERLSWMKSRYARRRNARR